MIPPTLLSSGKVLLVSFPWRNCANPPTHFSVRFDSSTPIAQTITVAKEVDPFTVSYLINSCGFSPESAKLVSKNVQLKNPSTPDSVLDFLKNYGFSDADVKEVIRKFPRVLVLKARTNLKPKMEFLLSIGIKEDDLVTIICRNPYLLGSSLNERIIPFYDLFKRVLVHDELVVKSLKFLSWVGRENLEKNVVANFELLKAVGVPESNIQYFFIHAFGWFGLDSAKFSERVNRVIGMGFDPSKYSFLEAIRYLPTKSTWERKAQICRSWGMSDSYVSFAFKKNPVFLGTSVEKLTNVMDFFVKKMGWDSSIVAAAPRLFSYSLKKHIIPRCSVIRVLLLKCLIKKDISLYTFLTMSKTAFLDRYVYFYLEQVPKLLEIYEGKVDLSELGYGFEDELDTKLN